MTMNVAKAIGRATSMAAETRALPSFAPRRRATEPVQDVLDHDDRRVDQEADGDRQPTERHRVQPDVERPQQKSCQRDRQWNGERHHQRRANVAEQQENHEHDEDAAQHDRSADASEGRVHELRLVVHRPQLNAFGQRASNVVDGLTNPGRDLHGVGAELLDDPRADDFALQAMRDASAHGSRLTNVSDVTEQHGHIPSNGDDGAPQVIDRVRAAQGTHGPFDRPLRDDAAGGVQVRLFDGVHHLIQADAPRGHALGIQLHLKLPQIATQTFDRRHAGNGQQAGCSPRTRRDRATSSGRPRLAPLRA